MINKTSRPSFREVVDLNNLTVTSLDDAGLQFNTQKVGPMNFAGLRQANYGQDFRMPTVSELIPLVYASLENQDYDTAKNVIQTLRYYLLTGNTGTLYTSKGMFVQDNPEMKDEIIVMNEKTLEGKLGKTEERGVTFSDDRSVRFTPYGFKTGLQKVSDLAENSGVIALSGSEQGAEMLAKAFEHYGINSYFWSLSDVENSKIRMVDLGSDNFGSRSGIGANYSEDDALWCSFGVRELEQGGFRLK
mgnify:CR=1 FL=1